MKALIAKVIDWIDDSPEHVLIFSLGCILAAVYWKTILGAIFWFVVTPGSFTLTYAVYRWWKKRKAS